MSTIQHVRRTESVGAASPDDLPQVDARAICRSEFVGPRTHIWPFAHVMRGAEIGADCSICDHAFVESGARIGNRVTVKNGAMIWEGVTIEDEVFVGPGVIFTNDRYPRSARSESAHAIAQEKQWLVRTMVKQGASIGAGAIIIGGVAIGTYAVIGAGAIVTQSVLDHRLVVGNPAKPIGWACTCGRILDHRLHCPECARHFTLAKDSLEPA